LIPADIARTTPGKAIGFCFIPIVNWYGVFVAFNGLVEDMNKTLQSRGIPFRVNEGVKSNVCIANLALWYLLYPCIVMDFTPVLRGSPSFWIGVGMIFLNQFFFFTSITNGAIVLLNVRHATKQGNTDAQQVLENLQQQE